MAHKYDRSQPSDHAPPDQPVPEDELSPASAVRTRTIDEASFQLAFEHGPLGMVFVDLDGVVVKVNTVFAEMLAYTPAELVGRQLTDVTHPDDVPESIGFLKSMLSSESPTHAIEKRYLTKDGESVWGRVTARAVGIGDDKPTCYLGFVENITERRIVEKKLQDSFSILNAVVEGTTDAVFVKDLNGRYRLVNSACARVMGKSEAEIIGSDDRALFSPDVAGRLMEADLEVVKAQAATIFEEIVKPAESDTSHFYLTTKAPLRDDHGDVIGIIGIAHDITERKKADEQIRNLTSDLEHASRLSIVGEMAAGVAHELHQPLAAIVNYSNGCKIRLQQDSPNLDEFSEVLHEISSTAMRSGEIVRRIRDFVQKHEVRLVSVNLNDIIQSALQLVTFEMKEREVELELAIDESLPRVLVDPVGMTQVIVNLVLNAIDAIHTSENLQGVLRIVTTSIEGKTVQVTVNDSGIGIAPEHRQRIFDQFFTTKEQGLGMGLSISQSIVARHDGQLTCESELGQGSTFVLVLPAS